jgi:hypothetical protein
LTLPSEALARRVKKAQLPDRLYHYTSQGGCIGIFHSKSIWATSIRFFNDEKEFVLAHDIAFEYLLELDATSEGQDAGFFRKLLDDFSIPSTDTYVTSFSTNGDLLSQWRGYAASGYSLGFAAERLARVTGPQLLLVPCVYDEEHQTSLVVDAADAAANYFRSLRDAGEQEDRAIDLAVEDFQASLAILAPIIKHSAFAEEGEWRLIATGVGQNSGRLRFRPGRSVITPYVELPLAPPGEVPFLDEVVVGPTPHPENAELVVWMLQRHTGVGIETVRKSSVPYRDW